MNQYIMTYLGGDKPSTPEEGKQHFVRYQDWLSSLGDAAIKPMAHLKTFTQFPRMVLKQLEVQCQ